MLKDQNELRESKLSHAKLLLSRLNNAQALPPTQQFEISDSDESA